MTSPQDRPSLEAVAAELTEAEERIRAAVSEVLPAGAWTRVMESRTAPCTENGQSARGAKQLFNGNWKLDAKPDELQWTQIRESILPILAEYGYTRVAMDLPVGDGAAFEVAGAYEPSRFSIEYDKATAMSFSSGCHFPDNVNG